MTAIVSPVRTNAEREQFIKLQWSFYGDYPNWVPPLLFDRRKLLDAKRNPFFQHAEMQLFLAERDGQYVGRIAAIKNDNHNREHNDTAGFFGFFECINDTAVAEALFAAVEAWLRERQLTVQRGPLNPSINDEVGLLIDGFEHTPMILTTYNPPYYANLLEACGFQKAKDMYAYIMEAEKVLTPKLERGQDIVRERYGITVRDFDFKRLKEEANLIKHLYNVGWEKNWGEIPMTDAEFDALAKDLAQVLSSHKRLVFFAERNSEPVGFALALPDINQVLIKNRRGWLLPGVFRMLTGMKSISAVRILVLGILPEHRGKGIDAVLYYEMLKRAATYDIHVGEASWVLEDNTMMNRGARMMNATAYKTYRIYDRPIK